MKTSRLTAETRMRILASVADTEATGICSLDVRGEEPREIFGGFFTSGVPINGRAGRENRKVLPARTRSANPSSSAHPFCSGEAVKQLDRSTRTMNTPTLIPVFTAIVSDESVQLCNARELHTTLQVGRDFATWINERVDTYGFVEGEDFVIDSPKSGNQKGRGGDRRSKDYHLTLDMAKELAMVENNEIGRQIRRYLIRLEKKAIAAGLKVDAVVSKAQLGEMSARIADRFPVAKDKPYAWSRFNNHFRLASYKDLPAEKYEEALAYIDQMPVKQQAAAVNAEKAPKKVAPAVISDYLQIHINRKTHEVAIGQYEAIRLIITEAVQSNLNCGAAEAEAHDLIEAYGDGASNVIVMNRRDVFMLASQTTHLLNTAGEALETIHRLEKHLGRNLYQRKQHGERGHFGLPESLVESVLNAVQEREAA